MSEWSKQISDFQGSLLQQQQQLVNDWLTTLQSVTKGKSPNPWFQAIHIIEQLINSSLNNQKQSLLTLIKNSERVEGLPEPLSQWFPQLEENIEQWNSMQHQFWQTWFDALRTAAPVDNKQNDNAFVKNWQDLTQRVLDFQTQWLSDWSNAQSTHSKPGKSRTAKSMKKGNGGSELTV